MGSRCDTQEIYGGRGNRTIQWLLKSCPLLWNVVPALFDPASCRQLEYVRCVARYRAEYRTAIHRVVARDTHDQHRPPRNVPSPRLEGCPACRYANEMQVPPKVGKTRKCPTFSFGAYILLAKDDLVFCDLGLTLWKHWCAREDSNLRPQD